jgi:hypothetical protein
LFAAMLGPLTQTTQANSIKLSENYNERVKKYREEGESYFELVSGGRFSLRLVVKRLSGENEVPRSEEVSFDLSAGNFIHGAEIPAGRKSFTSRIPGGRVVISRTKTGFVLTAAGRLSEDEEGLAAGNYSGNDEVGSVKIQPDEETLDCSVTIGDLSRSGEIGLRGTARTRREFRGRGDDREEFYLTKVNLKGQGSLEAEAGFDDEF